MTKLEMLRRFLLLVFVLVVAWQVDALNRRVADLEARVQQAEWRVHVLQDNVYVVDDAPTLTQRVAELEVWRGAAEHEMNLQETLQSMDNKKFVALDERLLVEEDKSGIFWRYFDAVWDDLAAHQAGIERAWEHLGILGAEATEVNP